MTMVRAGAAACLIVAALICAGSAAGAASYSDILGRWCGDRSNRFVTVLDFRPESFVVTWPDTNQKRSITIIRYEFGPGTVRVHWLNGNTPTWTEYGEFSPDGQRMLQLPTRGLPTYIFYRCSSPSS
jgi:hypothetical protein